MEIETGLTFDDVLLTPGLGQRAADPLWLEHEKLAQLELMRERRERISVNGVSA